MSGDPNSPRAMSVTLKQPVKDGTWVVFHGQAASIKEQILEFFEWSGNEELASLPLNGLVLEATRTYQGAGAASAVLGGTQTRGGSGGAWSGKGGSGGSSQPASTPEPDPEPVDPKAAMLDTINQLADLATHRDFWAKNATALKADDELVEAWKAKGTALKAAA